MRRSSKWRSAALAVCAAAAIIAGCGGEDGGSPEAAEEAAVGAVEASLSGDGTAACGYLSQGSLDALPGSDGTVASCEAAVSQAHGDDEPTRTVTAQADGVAVDGDVATVTVSGSSSGRSTGTPATAESFSSTVTLVYEEGAWKVTSIMG